MIDFVDERRPKDVALEGSYLGANLINVSHSVALPWRSGALTVSLLPNLLEEIRQSSNDTSNGSLVRTRICSQLGNLKLAESRCRRQDSKLFHVALLTSFYSTAS